MRRLGIVALLGMFVLAATHASATSVQVDAGVLQAWTSEVELTPAEPAVTCVTIDRDVIGWDWGAEVEVSEGGFTITKPAGSHEPWTWGFVDEPFDMVSVSYHANGRDTDVDTSPGVLVDPDGANLLSATFCYEDTGLIETSTTYLCVGYEDASFCRGPSDPDGR